MSANVLRRGPGQAVSRGSLRRAEGRAARARCWRSPYDVIGPEQRERYLASSPYNVVRLILPDSAEEAARLFAEWRREGILVEEDEDAVWWLRQDYEGPDGVARTRQGVVVSLGLEPYSTGVVRPHERTHAGPKATQLDLLRATHASLSPILLLYDDPSAGARRALEALVDGEPLLSAQDGPSTNSVWRITDPEAIAAARDALADQRLVIADGHHRYETALAFDEEQGTEQSGWTMAVLVNTHGEGLTIFPTHRVVGRAPELDNGFRVTPVSGGPHEALAALDARRPRASGLRALPRRRGRARRGSRRAFARRGRSGAAPPRAGHLHAAHRRGGRARRLRARGGRVPAAAADHRAGGGGCRGGARRCPRRARTSIPSSSAACCSTRCDRLARGVSRQPSATCARSSQGCRRVPTARRSFGPESVVTTRRRSTTRPSARSSGGSSGCMRPASRSRSSRRSWASGASATAARAGSSSTRSTGR